METILSKIGSAIATVGIFLGSIFGYTAPTDAPIIYDDVVVGATLPFAGHTYSLSGAGVTSSADSITLQSLTIPQTGQKIVDADLSTTFYLTLEPGHRTRQEIVSCTTVTQNSNDTATLTGCSRGLSPVTPFTASSTLRFSHGGGSQVIFSDPPQLFNEYAAKANDETITGQWTFDEFPITPDSPAASETTAGIVEISTGAEAAASTLSGTQGRLALSTAIASSTWKATTGNVVPVTDLSTNKLDNGFLATSTMFTGKTFTTGTTTFTGNVSITNASSTFASSTVKVFTGSGVWAKSTTTLKYIVVQACGGGGGGGGTANANDDAGSGGGGAGCVTKTIPAFALSHSAIVTIGGAGAAGTTGVGTAGGDTTFGSFLTASGGSPGTTAGDTSTFGGAGGAASGGEVNIPGQRGRASSRGDAAGDARGGDGGNSLLGYGGYGATLEIAAGAGVGYGGGGGGGARSGGATERAPGAGTAGIVIVTEYHF